MLLCYLYRKKCTPLFIKRKPEIVVISDVHLGTFGAHAAELIEYLDSVQPKKLILNGDFIDIWQFRKSYFPKTHLEVIKKIIDLSSKGTEVIYITGNHDEFLRKFSDTQIGDLRITDKLVLELDGKKAWFFHGDVFDVGIHKAKWIAKLGGWGYDLLILINRLLNQVLVKMGKKKYSLSKKIKNSVKNAGKFIASFEKTVSDLAIENGYKYVICGHIHQPKIIRKTNKKGTCLYLNSGDWIENLSVLEYEDKKWNLTYFSELKKQKPLVAAVTVIKKD
ncbi:phosphoesterase [Salegentibacter salarius]|uniref:Phosphoesterase n=1 Tax=Salegentibacter salarius TaxID=435906 RepID=A0A2N0TMN2_9FLAO|nr:UDP-2,3-diacylglucosamine diphosphatase [Salegentibacter salarius]OEY71367.1 UDP-2,3-diacylglucosamine hydrolase [Salegentibacter salarius]PKD16005.1 phosphoesterase [Salegentibacter salarius]SLJ92004.1 UDP-2,3-diacylglucosamine pyrophosphatase LpxH [Salegentibacter salarius]